MIQLTRKEATKRALESAGIRTAPIQVDDFLKALEDYGYHLKVGHLVNNKQIRARVERAFQAALGAIQEAEDEIVEALHQERRENS